MKFIKLTYVNNNEDFILNPACIEVIRVREKGGSFVNLKDRSEPLIVTQSMDDIFEALIEAN